MTNGNVRKNNDPFKVPEQYFQNLENRLAEAAFAEAAVEQKSKMPVIDLLKPYITMAASIVVVFGLLYFPMKRVTSDFVNSTTTEESLLELEFGHSMYHDVLYASEPNSEEESLVTDEMIEDVLLESISEYELIEYAQN